MYKAGEAKRKFTQIPSRKFKEGRIPSGSTPTRIFDKWGRSERSEDPLKE